MEDEEDVVNITVCNLHTRKGGATDIEVCTADEPDAAQPLHDPIIWDYLLQEFPKAQLQDSMNQEMPRMCEFEVADPVPVEDVSSESIDSAMDFTWVHRWKGSDIRSRLCVRGFKQNVTDLGDTLASAHTLIIMKSTPRVGVCIGMEHLHLRCYHSIPSCVYGPGG